MDKADKMINNRTKFLSAGGGRGGFVSNSLIIKHLPPTHRN